MDVRTLGPLEVVHAGAPIALTGTSGRAVVAMLALRAGSVVSVDEIIDGLWAIELPGDPAAAVQVTISRVRRALGDERAAVVRTSGGYVLEADTDIRRAEAAQRAGRDLLGRDAYEPAAAALSAGLREWRGQPLAEFVDLPFASPAIHQLHILRLDLLQARNHALLQCGRASEVIDDTALLLTTDAWREPLVGQLMLALYRTGRQVDALAAYAQLSSALRRDFDIEPSLPIQELHERIIRHDPGLRADRSDRPPVLGATGALPRWFEAALAAQDESDDRVRCRLLLALGEAQHYAGEPGWHETLLEAGNVARTLDDISAVASAALGGALGWAIEPGTANSRRVELLEHAMAAGDTLDTAVRARLAAAHATELMFVAPMHERRATSDTAVDLARASGEPATLLTVLNQRFSAVWSPATLDDRRQHVVEAAGLAEHTGPPVARALASGWQMAAAMESGNRREAETHFERFAALAEELELPLLQWGCVLHSCWRAVLDGELDRAEALAAEAQHVGMRANRPEAGFVGASQLAAVRWAQGRVGEVADLLSGLVAAIPHLAALRALEAVAIHATGESDRARRLLAAAREDGSITALDHNQVYLAALISWAELACALDAVDTAKDIAACLAPFADQFAFTGATVYGPVAHALGLLAFTSGDRDAAARHFGHAIAMSNEMPSAFFATRAQAAASNLGIVPV